MGRCKMFYFWRTPDSSFVASDAQAAGPDPVLLPIIYMVLVNIPYLYASHLFAFRPLGWFCIEYSAIGLLSLFLPFWLAAILILIAFVADVLSGVCGTYAISVLDCWNNLGVFVSSISFLRISSLILVVLLGLLLPVAIVLLNAVRLPRHERTLAAATMCGLMVLTLASDSVLISLRTGHFPNPIQSGSHFDGANFQKFPNAYRMARLPFLRLLRSEAEYAQVRVAESKGSSQPVASASALAAQLAGIHFGSEKGPKPNFVLVLVESWGAPNDPQLGDALVSSYDRPELKENYEIVRGTVPFYGSTVAGEARELCGNRFGMHLIAADRNELQGCLPDEFAKLGYLDIAVHGMRRYMFNRSQWYGAIGFQEMRFHKEFAGAGLPDCVGALTGTCDAAIAGWIGNRLAQPLTGPVFVHWVTLNSHLPVPVPSPQTSAIACSSSLSLTPGTPLCSWYQLVRNLHESVAQVASRLTTTSTVFVVVGDHAPPFADANLHDRFSQQRVPYIILIPKKIAQPATQLAIRDNPQQPVRHISRTAQVMP